MQTASPKRRRRQAPARGLAAVYSRHRPKRNEAQHIRPLLVGRVCCSPCVIPVQGERKGRFLATLPCPVGARGAAGARGRRCLPCGAKALQSGAPDLGWFMGKSILWGALPIRGAFPARRGTESGQLFIQTAFPNRRRRQAPARGLVAVCTHSRPKRNESQPVCPCSWGRQASTPSQRHWLPTRRALPAPAQGSRPLRIPFGGTAAVSPRPPSPKKRRRRQAPARGPAAVYSRHRPNRTETQSARPLLVGRALVDPEPKATGRRHCRPSRRILPA